MAENQNLIDEPDYPVTLTEANFQEAVDKYALLVVDLWAPWCGPCKMLGPIIESLAKKRKADITFGKLNVDDCPSIASKFGVMSIPTLLVFKNGEKIEEFVGAMPEEMLEQKIDAVK